jgi:hypothetical protein
MEGYNVCSIAYGNEVKKETLVVLVQYWKWWEMRDKSKGDLENVCQEQYHTTH